MSIQFVHNGVFEWSLLSLMSSCLLKLSFFLSFWLDVFFFVGFRRRLKKLNCLTLLFNDLSLERQVTPRVVLTSRRRHSVMSACMEKQATTSCYFFKLTCVCATVPLLWSEGFAPLAELRYPHLRDCFCRPDARFQKVSLRIGIFLILPHVGLLFLSLRQEIFALTVSKVCISTRNRVTIFFNSLSSNFEMAVSYGATFPVIVLLLSIAFTGYLEVNKDQLGAMNSGSIYIFIQYYPEN